MENIKVPKLNLVQFTKEVKAITSKMNEDELREFILELVRVCPEDKRYGFTQTLRFYSSALNHENIKKINQETDIVKKTNMEADRLIKIFEEINEGNLTLDSKYNEEWDDWYNSDEDEIFFYDPEHIADTVSEAMKLIHYCVDNELFETGYRLAAEVAGLCISVEGDYNDYDGSSLNVKDLYLNNLFSYDYDIFEKECLYLTCVNNPSDTRAEALYTMLRNLDYPDINLEKIFQTGLQKISDQEQFPEIWLDYLLGLNYYRGNEKYIKEAYDMSESSDFRLKSARKFVGTRPSLYRQFLETKVSCNEFRKMYDIGMEAVSNIPCWFTARSDVALLTAEYALKLGMKKEAELCWLEAFRSDSSVENYWRIRLLSEDWENYRDEIKNICETGFSFDNLPGHSERDGEKLNNISFGNYCIFLLFDGRFSELDDMCEKAKGKSCSYQFSSGEEIRFILVKLYDRIEFSDVLTLLCGKLESLKSIKPDSFMRGTLRNNTWSSKEILNKIITEWKKGFDFSEEQKKKMLEKAEAYISDVVSNAMTGQHRSQYSICALLVTALGEVAESLGKENGRMETVQKFKNEYPRHRSFHKELNNLR